MPAKEEDHKFIVSIRKERNLTHEYAGVLFYYGLWIITKRSAVVETAKREDPKTKIKQYYIRNAPRLRVYPKWSNALANLTNNRFWDSDKTFCHPFRNVPGEKLSHTDIALIKLSQSIPLDGKEGFSSIELVDEDIETTPPGDHPPFVSIAGWGIYDPQMSDPPFSEYLMEAYMEIVRNASIESPFYWAPAHILIQLKDVAICKGDFGGPATVWVEDCPRELKTRSDD